MGMLDKIMFWRHNDSGINRLNLKSPQEVVDTPNFSQNSNLYSQQDNLGLGSGYSNLGEHDYARNSFSNDPNFGSSALDSRTNDPFSYDADGQKNNFGTDYNSQLRLNQGLPDSDVPGHYSSGYNKSAGRENMQPAKDYITEKNFEILSSKLDAMRASIEIINQRLANIERIAQQEQKQGKRHDW